MTFAGYPDQGFRANVTFVVVLLRQARLGNVLFDGDDANLILGALPPGVSRGWSQT